MKEAVDNKLDADPLEVAQLYSQTMQRYNAFDTADIARFVKNTANTNSVDDIAGMLFNGNTEAAQKFVEKYSNIEIPEVDTELADSTGMELPSVILGTAKSYDEIQNVDQTIIPGYNSSTNVDQNNGGYENVDTIDNRGLGEIDSQRSKAGGGTEDKEQRTRPEDEGTFRQRNSGSVSGRTVIPIKNTLFAYTPKDADGSQASKAVEILNKAGIKAVYCEGNTESNADGATTLHTEAVTAPDGTIYVSDTSSLSSIQIAAHEAVHYNQKNHTKEYAQLETTIYNNLLWDTDKYVALARDIFEAYHRAKYEKKAKRVLTDDEINYIIKSPKYRKAFLIEFTAYVNEVISANSTEAIEQFSKAFTNWDAVVEASRRFNEAIGLDFSEADVDTTTQPGEPAPTGITELSPADMEKDAVTRSIESVTGYKELTEEQKTIRDIGRKLGWKVEFAPVRTPKGSRADGKISFSTKTITIDPASKKPIQFILKHELAHSLEQNKAAYAELQNAIMDSKAFKDYVKSQGFASVSAYNADIVARYKAEGVEGFDSTRAEYKANCEMVANFVGDCLFGGDTRVTAKLLEEMKPPQRRSFIQLVKDFLAGLKAKLTGKHKRLTDEISKLEDAFLKVLNSVETKENTAENDGESYSIATDSKNRKVVVLDRNIFNGVVDLKARAEALEDWIINNFGGTKHNTSDYFFVVMNERTAGKMKFWNENMDAVAYERKLSAAEHIDELIKISKFDRYSKNVKDKHKAFANKGWNYFKSYFTDGKRIYEADISVAKSNEQSVVYNIGYIKDVGQYEPNNKSSYSLTGSPNESVTIPENEASNRNSTDRIPQKEVSVNSNSMQESEDYSISTAPTSRTEILTQLKNGEISVEEADELLSRKKTLNPAAIANMKEEDANTTPKLKRRQGENKGDKESKFHKSLMGSSIFDDTFKQEAANDSFIQKYQSVTNAETLKKAAEALDEGGEEYVKRWRNIEPEQASLIDTAVGFILMDRYQRVGDYESAIFAAEKVKAFGTAGGQKIQLFSILSRLDPNTMVIYAQRELTSAFNILQKKRTQKWIDENAARFNLNEEEIEFIRRRTLQAAQLPEGRDRIRP